MSDINLDAQGDVTVGEFIGRDKIVQNIILVGRFLELAQIESLLPKSSVPVDFKNVRAALESTFSAYTETNLAQATAFAGELLRDFLLSWAPHESHTAVRFKVLIPSLASHIVNKLIEYHYWEAFSFPTQLNLNYPAQYTAKYQTIEVIWLDALNQLRKRYLNKDDWRSEWAYKMEYGLAIIPQDNQQNKQIEPFFVCNDGNGIRKADFTYYKSEDFRIFVAGLLIDLIRMSSVASADVQFLVNIMDFFGPKGTG